jgi:hypothetical protein
VARRRRGADRAQRADRLCGDCRAVCRDLQDAAARALSWHDVSIGALGTAALFTLGKYAIGAYIGNSGVASSYGAAGR